LFAFVLIWRIGGILLPPPPWRHPHSALIPQLVRIMVTAWWLVFAWRQGCMCA